MDFIQFEEGKIYECEMGLLYVKRRNKRSIRAIILDKHNTLYLSGNDRKIPYYSPMEWTYNIYSRIYFKPYREVEYIKFMNEIWNADKKVDKYKCQLVIAGEYGYKLKELVLAGLEIERLFIDVNTYDWKL